MEDSEDEDEDATSISHLFVYLRAIYLWLGHPPSHPWEQESINPIDLFYLLHDAPEIFFWEHRNGMYRYTPNLSRKNKTFCWHDTTR